MSKSLTGGLVPLGKRTGSNPVGSSTLSGGLIPLATGRSTRATAPLGRIQDGSFSHAIGGNNGGTARDEEEDPIAEQEGIGIGSGREKKHKRSSASKADANRASRRGRAKPIDQSSRSGSKEDLANTTGSSKKLATEPEEDDSYLFMGATAGTKGRKSGGGAAEAAALLLDSDDSFGLPKMSGGRKVKPTPSKNETETTGDNAGGGYSKDGGEQGRKQETDTSYFSSTTKHTQPTSQAADGNRDAYSSGTARSATAGGDNKSPQGPSPRLDLDEDFDSSDEADALLRLTDPTALAASAPVVPPLGVANPREDHKPRGRADTTSPAVSERRATDEERAPRQRSPSPPLSRRRALPDSPERSPRRLLPGRGFTQGKPADDSKGGVLEKTGGVGGLDVGRVQRAESGAHPASTVSTEGADKLVTIEPAIRSRSRARGVGLSQRPSRENVDVDGNGTGESLRIHEPGVEASAGGSSGHNHDGSGKQGAGGNAGGSLVATGAGVASSNAPPRRSALAGVGKPRSLEPKSRAVTFDDDLGGLDALDILPSSDDDDEAPDGGPVDESPKTLLKSSTTTEKSAPLTAKPAVHSVMDKSDRYRPSESHATTSSATARRGSTSITKGLSPAAARLMAEDSSSEESIAGPSVAGAGLGLEAGPKSLTAVDTGVAASLGLGPKAAEGDGDITDDAQLDLALGFTPSSMDGGRRPRRTLPAGRRGRSSIGMSPTTNRGGADYLATIDSAPTPSAVPLAVPTPNTLPLRETPRGVPAQNTPQLRETPRGISEAETGAVMGKGKDEGDGEASHPNLTPPPAFPRVVDRPVPDVVGRAELDVGANAATVGTPRAAAVASVEPLTTTSRSMKGPASDNAPAVGTSDGIFGYIGEGARRGGDAPSPKQAAAVGLGNMDASVLLSLERQLALLAGDRESAATRIARDEQRLQRESDSIRDALSVAEARAFEAEAALAAARARIQQLEVEAAENASRLAASESRAATGRRTEQETCLSKISEGERRHQSDLHKAETRHEETVSELKRLHHEEVEDIRQRNADSKTLETLAGQVHESAGAVKLLQAEMVQRQGVSEVSREGQMEARERLVKELEQSARRAQQTAEDEVQRLQGTLMAMDQVMRALRGQNAGERERLRQEHLRMETLQGAMVAEVEAVRQSVDEERQRLAERCAALDRDKRQADAAARTESERLTEQRIELKTERESFAALQVSTSQAAEEMVRRQANAEEILKLARQTLEREASSLEDRLAAARADLQKADDVRSSLDRLRDQDELERRRLKALAGELERAFEEVRARATQTEERRVQAEMLTAEALEASTSARKEKEVVQLRAAQVEQVARLQETERTNTAQARAQSATELSTSRRLKAELARAVAFQERQARGAAADCHRSVRRHNGGDTGAGTGVGFNRLGVGGGTLHLTQDVPPEATLEPAVLCSAASMSTGWGIADQSRPDDAAGIPFTGIAAAEATLQASSSAPPFPGLDVARELSRLARRAADLRECTREQKAFLSSSRAVRFNVELNTPRESSSLSGAHLEIPPLFPGLPIFNAAGASSEVDLGLLRQRAPGLPIFNAAGVSSEIDLGLLRQQVPGLPIFNAAGASSEVDLGLLGQRIGGGWSGFGGASAGCGLSSAVLEDLEEVERACLQRASALKEEEQFVETLGREDSPVAP